MAELVQSFGSSHSVMLTAELADWQTKFVAADQLLSHFDRDGNPTTYAALEAAAPPGSAALIAPEAIARRHAAAHEAMAHLRRAIKGAALDALIIVGDDQHELFPESSQPALGIYWGETIRNAAQRQDLAPEDWYKRAQNRRREKGAPVAYPVHCHLALSLIEGLTTLGFDVTAVKALSPDQHEGHAYSFAHHMYLRGVRVPIVPIFLNTYYPPNQPTPPRCRDLGLAIAELVARFPERLRVGMLASGGLSHFIVDEALDHQVIDAIRRRDLGFLAALPPKKLQAGSSEIRNWIVTAAASLHLDLVWTAYVPGYRTPALTGTGLGFAHWS